MRKLKRKLKRETDSNVTHERLKNKIKTGREFLACEIRERKILSSERR